MIKLPAGKKAAALLEQVEALSDQNLAACYQCGTCSAGCPFAAAMDTLPEQLIRQINFGLPGVLESNALWLCVSCYLCAERCPRDIDVARVMEALRQIRLQQSADHINIGEIPQDVLQDVPPIALVANFRKNTG